VQNLEMTLAKSSIEIAREYLPLVEDARLWPVIEAEHERAVAAVLDIVETDRLLDRHPVLQRSIELRNPYVDPMSFLQIRMIEEVRTAVGEEKTSLLRSIIDRSVAGIAAGLQNTG
jgi:phosphoenolpyruvate carboxylase